MISRKNTPGWNGYTLLTAAAALCAAGWLFVAIANSIAAGTSRAFDERILMWFRDPAELRETIGPFWLSQFAGVITHFGSAVVVIMASLGMIGYLARRKEWRYVVLIIVTVAGSYALNYVLKSSYARARPSVVPHLATVSSASFPSGHSQAASVAYLTLAALLSRHVPSRRQKLGILTAALVLVGVIGVSRVFLGVHYPSDVLAGWSIGTAWALLWLLAMWQPWSFRKSIETE